MLALPRRELCFRVGYFARDIVTEFFERVRTFDAEITAAIAVGIDVRDAVRAQFVIVLLGPFGRAQESRLFSVPRTINDGALGLPAGLDQFAESPGFFQDGNLS